MQKYSARPNLRFGDYEIVDQQGNIILYTHCRSAVGTLLDALNTNTHSNDNQKRE